MIALLIGLATANRVHREQEVIRRSRNADPHRASVAAVERDVCGVFESRGKPVS